MGPVCLLGHDDPRPFIRPSFLQQQNSQVEVNTMPKLRMLFSRRPSCVQALPSPVSTWLTMASETVSGWIVSSLNRPDSYRGPVSAVLTQIGWTTLLREESACATYQTAIEALTSFGPLELYSGIAAPGQYLHGKPAHQLWTRSNRPCLPRIRSWLYWQR